MRFFRKIFITVFIMFLIAVMAITWVIARRYITDVRELLISETILTGRMVADEIEVGYNEQAFPFEMLKDLSERKDLIFWWVVKENGAIYLANEPKYMQTDAYGYFPEQTERPEAEILTVNDKKRYGLFALPMTVAKQNWSFWIGFSLQRIIRAQHNIIFAAGIILLLTSALFYFVLYFSVSRLIQPVLELRETTRQIGAGNMDARANSRGNDEVGDLALAFNQMATDLQKYQSHLEQLVDERTLQLKQANKRLQLTYQQLKDAHGVIEEELDVAREIQMATIPLRLPEIDGYNFFVNYVPAEKVGGDFYHFYQVDSDHLGIFIADASGHGIPAAFVASMASMSFASHTPGNLSTAAVLCACNEELDAAIHTAHYLTAFYLILHIPSGKIVFTRAGHPLPYLYKGATRTLEQLKSKGGFIAMMADTFYEEKECIIEPGDKLLLYTDGINEALNKKEELFGKKRIENHLQMNGKLHADEIGEGLVKKVKSFRAEAEVSDDATLIIIERTGETSADS